MADDPTKTDAAPPTAEQRHAERRKARGAGIYADPAGGFHVSITAPNGALKDLGIHKTHEAAKAVYAEAQAKLYPIAPTPPSTGHVGLVAQDLETARPTLTMKAPKK